MIYSMFCGVGLAITAVPILGRILRDFDLTGTEIEVRVVAISAAALLKKMLVEHDNVPPDLIPSSPRV